MSNKTRRQLIEGIRAVADFYESNAGAYYDGMTVVLRMFSGGRSAAKDLASMADAFGDWQDLTSGQYITIAKDFGARVRLELYCPRAKVCRRVVLDTRIEPACFVPARKGMRIPQGVVEIEGWLPPSLPGLRKKS